MLLDLSRKEMAADLKSLPGLAEGELQRPAAAVQPRRVVALHLQLHFHLLQLQFHLQMEEGEADIG